MAHDTKNVEPAPAPGENTLDTAVRPETSTPATFSRTGLIPIVSVLVRVVQLLLCVIALAVTASIKETDSSVLNFDFTVVALNVSFTDFDAFIFQLVACCFVLLYTLALLVLASLKFCNLFGGIYRTNRIWWGQVIGDLLLGELLFAAACSGATIAAYLGKNLGGFGPFYTLANVSVAFSFLTSFTLLASAFVLIYALSRNKL